MPFAKQWLAALGVMLAGSAAQAAALDARDLETFFAGAVGSLMTSYHVPGVAVAVVHDGAVVFAGGYGVADVESGRPVDPESTLFRVASVTKPFTATAVMQLVEQGQLDLDADITTYAPDLSLPPDFAEPITLRHLLTHTAGFENVHLGSEPLDATPTPLASALARYRPLRIRPPGRLLTYSNYGYGLAAVAVERVTGEAFVDFVRNHVLVPLGMTRSGFSVSSPAPQDLAVPYSRRSGRFHANVYGRLPAGAGGLYVSALDVSRFMLAHLADGQVPGGDERILSEATARLMHARAFTHHPELPGWCLGFDERRYGHVRAIGHGGGMQGVGADLVLVPEAGIGLFVATNLDYESNFLEPLVRAFLARYVPASVSEPAPRAAKRSRADARGVAGRYVTDRHTRSSIQKLALLSESLEVSVEKDGSLTIEGDVPGFDPMHALPIARDLWSDAGDLYRVAVLRSETGAVEHLVIDASTFDRVSALRDPELHELLLRACAAVFAATLVGFGLGGLARASGRWPVSSVPLVARAVASAAAATALATLGAAVHAFATLSPFARSYAAPVWLRFAQLLPLLSLALGLGVVWSLLRSRSHVRLARLHFAVLALALAVYLALAWEYNLVSLG